MGANDFIARMMIWSYSCIKIAKEKQFIWLGDIFDDCIKFIMKPVELFWLSHVRCICTDHCSTLVVPKRKLESHQSIWDSLWKVCTFLHNLRLNHKSNMQLSPFFTTVSTPKESVTTTMFYELSFISAQLYQLCSKQALWLLVLFFSLVCWFLHCQGGSAHSICWE